MKDTFNHPTKTLVEEALLRALSAKKSFVVFNVGTTGYNPDDVATRIYAQLYSYNKASKQYELIKVFDKLLAPPPEFLAEISDEDSVKRDQVQRIFRSAGISFDDYLAGTNTLTPQEMVTELGFFMKAAERCEFGLINGISFTEPYLTKIGAYAPFARMRQSFHLFDQADLTKAKYPQAPSNALDNIAVYAYRQFDVRTAAQKATLLYDIIRDYGEDGAVLAPKSDQAADKVARDTEASEKGKARYQSAELAGKFDILLGNTKGGFTALQPKTPYFQGHGWPEIYTPETDRLREAFEKKKGFTVLAVSTTGVEHTGKYPVHNQPIRMTVLPCVFDETEKKLVPMKAKGFECDIFASETEILAAKSMADSGGYDVFHHGDIDYDEYRKASMEGRLASATQVAIRMNEYFKEYPIADYPVLSCATAEYRGKYISFAQEALLSMEGKDEADKTAAAEIFTSIPGFTHRGIDFTQFLKEAVYQKYTGTESFANTLCDLSRWTEGSFSLECFVRHHKGDPSYELNGSRAKAYSVASLTRGYYQAYLTNEPVLVKPAAAPYVPEKKALNEAPAPVEKNEKPADHTRLAEEVAEKSQAPMPPVGKRLNLRRPSSAERPATISEPAPEPKAESKNSASSYAPSSKTEPVVKNPVKPEGPVAETPAATSVPMEQEALSSLILLCRTQASMLEKQTVLLEQQGKLMEQQGKLMQGLSDTMQRIVDRLDREAEPIEKKPVKRSAGKTSEPEKEIGE